MECGVLKRVYATFVAVVISVSAFSQNYYLVIGAFSTEKNDVKEITGFLPGNSIDTAYTVRTDNSTLQFYVMKSSKEEVVAAKSLQLRNELSTHDNASPKYELADMTASPATSSSNSPSENAALKPRGKFFKFTITNEEGQFMPGLVHRVDPISGAEVERFQTDQYIDLPRSNSQERLDIVCAPFGYKAVEKIVDYSSPWLTEGAFIDDRGAWVIPYSIEKLEVGDVTGLYDVSFYKDGAILLPVSKDNLDQLVNLMTTNPKYVITLHSHCNGKNTRKVSVPNDYKKPFDIGRGKEVALSAKDLTKLRGESVKAYLVANGIEQNRVKVYGWGASDMLVKYADPNSKINDRIEIEIMKD
jgi:outer membrane protein OmpA-like peptidoglycan-associated protein